MRKDLIVRFFMLMCVVTAILILVGNVSPVYSQVGPASSGNPCPGGEPCDPEVPIAGIEWLLLIGGLFGFRKIYHKFRK